MNATRYAVNPAETTHCRPTRAELTEVGLRGMALTFSRDGAGRSFACEQGTRSADSLSVERADFPAETTWAGLLSSARYRYDEARVMCQASPAGNYGRRYSDAGWTRNGLGGDALEHRADMAGRGRVSWLPAAAAT